MNLFFLYLSAQGTAVIGVTVGSEERAAENRWEECVFGNRCGGLRFCPAARTVLLERGADVTDLAAKHVHHLKTEGGIVLETVQDRRARNEGQFRIVNHLGGQAVGVAGDSRRQPGNGSGAEDSRGIDRSFAVESQAQWPLYPWHQLPNVSSGDIGPAATFSST